MGAWVPQRLHGRSLHPRRRRPETSSGRHAHQGLGLSSASTGDLTHTAMLLKTLSLVFLGTERLHAGRGPGHPESHRRLSRLRSQAQQRPQQQVTLVPLQALPSTHDSTMGSVFHTQNFALKALRSRPTGCSASYHALQIAGVSLTHSRPLAQKRQQASPCLLRRRPQREAL